MRMHDQGIYMERDFQLQCAFFLGLDLAARPQVDDPQAVITHDLDTPGIVSIATISPSRTICFDAGPTALRRLCTSTACSR